MQNKRYTKKPVRNASHRGADKPVNTNNNPSSNAQSVPASKSQNLRIIPLGGLGEFGKNMMLLEYQNQILIIDAGFRMPDEDMPGIDYLISNTSYLKGKEKNIVGAIITHGHYDHFGAIPYTWPRIGNPRTFAGKLAASIIMKRQEEFPDHPKLDITQIGHGSKIKLGVFKIEFFRQNHSTPDNFGLFIETPVGNILHTSDFKFDAAPVNDKPTDFNFLEQLAKRGILLMMCDSTGSESEGHSLSEKTIYESLEKIFQEASGRIISSTFASHLNRIQQLISLAEKYNRKVAIAGRSLETNLEIARNLKYLTMKKGTLVKARDISKYPDNQVSFICTGAQGEERATFMRIATGEYRHFNLKRGDSIVFSSSVIPGNERSVQVLKDGFYRQGAKVYHYQMMDIHTSGHAYQEEISKMTKIMKPKFLLPLHGQYSMLVKTAELAREAGVSPNNIKVIENGQVLNINANRTLIEEKTVPVNYIMVDGLGVGDVGEVVLRDRQNLSQDGMFVIVAVIDRQAGKVKGSPDIISRGFVYLRESQELLRETRKRVIGIINKSSKENTLNPTYIKDELRNKIGDFLFSKTKRRPIILPVIIEV
ncbi:MAG: ribonuclease J [Parcubacteria group bacterium]|nr:ribonuclease J [Parcubacteria group bacterium]